MSDFDKIPLDEITWRDCIEAVRKVNEQSSLPRPDGSAVYCTRCGTWGNHDLTDHPEWAEQKRMAECMEHLRRVILWSEAFAVGADSKQLETTNWTYLSEAKEWYSQNAGTQRGRDAEPTTTTDQRTRPSLE